MCWRTDQEPLSPRLATRNSPAVHWPSLSLSLSIFFSPKFLGVCIIIIVIIYYNREACCSEGSFETAIRFIRFWKKGGAIAPLAPPPLATLLRVLQLAAPPFQTLHGDENSDRHKIAPQKVRNPKFSCGGMLPADALRAC